MSIKLNDKFLDGFVKESEIDYLQPFADNAYDLLMSGKGPGSDFLGWVDLPNNYDKDEFARIKTTISGHAIIQEEDGWWCYAQFSEDGSRHSTGYRVGERMPGIIEATTLDIPYGKIHRIGEQLRSVAVSPRLLNTDNDTSEITEKHGLVILAQFSDFSFK